MILIDLNEQADRDFGRARRRSWLRRLVSRLQGEPASRRIPPSFDEARRSLRALNRMPRGTRAVDPQKIVGSVGRRRDFDRSFLPLRASAGERWKRVDLAFHRNVDLLPVSLYRRLLSRGRQPPRLRRPLPRRRVDRRRRHGASARADRGRPTSSSRSRAGIAARMIQARSPAGRSAHPGLAAALPSTREAREPTREPAKAAKEPSTDGGYGPLLGDED